MSGTFNGAAVDAVMAAVKSIPAKLGTFRSSVVFHEPRSAPATLPAVALWGHDIQPIGQISGLAEVSGRVSVHGRIYVANAQQADDRTEAQLLTLMSGLLGAFAGAFTLGGDAMFVDLLGAYGEKLSATAGYIDHDGAFFRVAECVFPIIIDPLWQEVP